MGEYMGETFKVLQKKIFAMKNRRSQISH